jgi:hypothetical protein
MPLTPGLVQTELVDEDRFVTQPWQVHFRDQTAAMATVPVRQQVVQLPPVAGAIPVTSIATGSLPSGLYRVTAAVRVTVPAATSSSVAVTLHWVDGGVVCSLPMVLAVTGNTTASVGTGTAMVHSDAATPISYSTAYASVAAGMAYQLHLVLETMGGE